MIGARLLFTTFFLLLAVAVADATDIPSLDIGGVRLGMTGPEAISAIKAKYGANTHIKVEYGVSRITGHRAIASLAFNAVQVDLIEAIPPSRADTVVWRVRVDGPADVPAEQMLSAARIKYGPPDISPSNVSRDAVWCVLEDRAKNLGEGAPCAREPQLVYWSNLNALVLQDDRPGWNADAYINAMPHATPKF